MGNKSSSKSEFDAMPSRGDILIHHGLENPPGENNCFLNAGKFNYSLIVT